MAPLIFLMFLTSFAYSSVEYVGLEKYPVFLLDQIFSDPVYQNVTTTLRQTSLLFDEQSSFPGMVQSIDPFIVDTLLNSIRNDGQIRNIYSPNTFTRANVRGFTTILCSDGFIHHDLLDTKFSSKSASSQSSSSSPSPPSPSPPSPPSPSPSPSLAAVFYIGFPIVRHHSVNIQRKTGTMFFREITTGIERTKYYYRGGTSILNQTRTQLCTLHPTSMICPETPGSTTSCGDKFDYNDCFEEIYRIGGKPNSMVLYPADVYHNAWYEGDDLPCRNSDGRLAISLFFGIEQGGRLIQWNKTIHGADEL
jgi:hypothetical protein